MRITCSVIILLLSLINTALFSQNSDRKVIEPSATHRAGIALDVFPLLNGIFSDNPNADLTTIQVLWGSDLVHHEAGIGARFKRTKTDADPSALKQFGIDISYFHGKTHLIAKHWFVTFGLIYKYGYDRSSSGTDSTSQFIFTSTQHTGGLGPQLMFGYRMADQIWLRSRIAGLLQYSSSNTKIGDGPFSAGGQSINEFGFDISRPTVLELVYIF